MSEEKRCGKYDHVEAFCIMRYLCEKCKEREFIWNSRDGVTPMFIECDSYILSRKCDGMMSHINFSEDECMPDHFPLPGMRVFVDFPENFREVFKKRLINMNWNTGTCPMNERFKTKQEALETLMDGETQEGEPYVLKL